MTLTGINIAILVTLLVISREQILEQVPIGTAEEEAIAYFETVTEKERIHYYTRPNLPQGTVSYILKQNERGYYLVGISGVQSRWWWPSFGRHLVVLFAVSDTGRVSHMEFFGSRSGWP